MNGVRRPPSDTRSTTAVASSGGGQCTSDTVLLGRITGAHGIRGDVIVHSYAAVPEDIAAYGPLSNADGTRTFKLRVLHMTPKGAVVARVAGVTDRNAAEALKGTELYVDRSRLPAPGDGEYYHADLIGLAAVSPAGEAIGEIVGVQNYGAGDLLEIRMPGLKDTELLPFNDDFVPEIDLAARKAVVVMPAADDDAGPD